MLETIDAGAGLYGLAGNGGGSREEFPIRGVGIRLPGGGMLLYSPPPMADEDTVAAFEALGPVDVLVAGNSYHHMGLPFWKTRHPHAAVVASETALPRLRKKAALPFDGPVATIADRLPDHVTMVVPDGLKTGEVWFRVNGEGGTTLVVCDGWFNMDPCPPGMFGWIMRRLAIAPGLKVGRTTRWLAVSDKRTYSDFVRRELHDHPPSALVVSHGLIARGSDVAERMERAMAVGLGV